MLVILPRTVGEYLSLITDIEKSVEIHSVKSSPKQTIPTYQTHEAPKKGQVMKELEKLWNMENPKRFVRNRIRLDEIV